MVIIICLKATEEGRQKQTQIPKYRQQQQFKPRLRWGPRMRPRPPFLLTLSPPSNYHQLVMFHPSSHVSHLNICPNAIFYAPKTMFPPSSRHQSLDVEEWNKKGENFVRGDSLKYFCWNKTVIMLSGQQDQVQSKTLCLSSILCPSFCPRLEILWWPIINNFKYF